MSPAFALWTGIAVMALLAVFHEILHRKMASLEKRIQANLAEYRAEVRAFEERYEEGNE